MRRIRAGLLALLLLCPLCLPVSAQTGAALTIGVSDDVAFAGDTVCVTLALSDGLPDVGSLELHLRYDPAVFTPQDLTAGDANSALQVIMPTADNPYTGVLFVYDYGAGGTDKVFHAGTLFTAVFAVREDVAVGGTAFTVDCAAALDTAFRPLVLAAPSAAQIAVRTKPTVRIHKFVSSVTVAYRTTLKLHADVTDPIEGGEVHWFIGDADVHTGDTITLSQLRADVTVRTEYRFRGRTLAVSDTQTVHVNAGFFMRLAAFFRALFGALPIVIQSL